MKEKWELVREGKVRKVYEDSEHRYVLLLAGDGVSAFDQELGVEIPGKGRMLTKISRFWFEKTGLAVYNAYSAFKAERPDFVVPPELGLDPEATTPMIRLNMLPVEAIVRGYMTGSLWTYYKNRKRGDGGFCGITFSDNDIRESEKLREPIFTPTTKAPKGEHDENLSFPEMVEHLKKHGVMDAESRAELIEDYSLRLYEYAHLKLLGKGIILADAKFEFGIDPSSGNLMLGDELFTPDSSRFWRLRGYEIGEPQASLDKQMIRDYVLAYPDTKVPQEILEETAMRYETITNVILERGKRL